LSQDIWDASDRHVVERCQNRQKSHKDIIIDTVDCFCLNSKATNQLSLAAAYCERVSRQRRQADLFDPARQLKRPSRLSHRCFKICSQYVIMNQKISKDPAVTVFLFNVIQTRRAVASADDLGGTLRVRFVNPSYSTYATDRV
jgi:hypothetical protein